MSLRNAYLLLFLFIITFTACNKTAKTDGTTSRTETLSDLPKKPANNNSPLVTIYTKYLEAHKTHDVSTIKDLLSKDSLDMLEYFAKERELSLDELLQNNFKNCCKELKDTAIEFKDERIGSGKAILEIKNPLNKKWEELPFVKENNEWKIALDKWQHPDAGISISEVPANN